MARRKDHSPAELKQRIHAAAINLIESKGLPGLTARALAARIGYAAGTIYNFYRDMDALVTEVNYATLRELDGFARARLAAASPGYASVRALADAYIDFAQTHERAWRTLFIATNRTRKTVRLPADYQACLDGLFALIDETLQKHAGLSPADAAKAGRLLWASLHGIAALMLDGRLNLTEAGDPHAMVDDLLRKYLGISDTAKKR